MKAFATGKRSKRNGRHLELTTTLEVDGEQVPVVATVKSTRQGFVPCIVEVDELWNKFVLDGTVVYADWFDASQDMLNVLNDGVFWVSTGRHEGRWVQRSALPLGTVREIKAAAKACINAWLEPHEALKNGVVRVDPKAPKPINMVKLGKLEEAMLKLLNRNPWKGVWASRGERTVG